MIVDIATLRPLLKQFEFKKLFNLLGWNKFDQTVPIEVGGHLFHLQGVAQQRGVQIFVCSPDAAGKIPAHGLRRKIDTELSKSAQEHLLIFADAKETTQLWQWLSREAGRTTVLRQQTYYTSTSGDALLQKLDHIAFPLSAEESLTLTGVVRQLKDAFDREKVTKTFYDRFKVEHDAFLKFIAHIPDTELQRWYASVMINRLMFLYFIQGKGFLDGKTDYLKSKLDGSQGHYYRDFLYPLFFDGLAKREAERTPAVQALLGRVPYLNGGLFAKHQIEEQYGEKIKIPDEAFERLYKFFQEFDWTLDERPIRNGKEINPDVLGYIFEKYINQKQMGAYYTKEDITEYIGKNTILLFLFDQARRDCGTAFKSEHTVWELLAADPDAYIYSAVRHGTDLPLPKNIAQGVDNVAGRANWNQPAPPEYGLPTEIWRETVARRERYAAVRDKLASGSVQDINDFVTLNLNIRQFALDALTTWEGADLIRAFWDAIRHITILDPTCGSGAFLFAALEILKPLYEACLDRMGGFVADADQLGRANDHKAFRETLKEVAKHPNRDYFVFKSIIVNNLYGVDIMEEATEICKLRLFLKLAAQVEPDIKKDNFGIEPLPDIDFNIRAGNTLVGFATEAQTEIAVTGRLDYENVWPTIKSKAAAIAKLFEDFQKSQNELDAESGYMAGMKAGLRERLTGLRDELDKYLGQQYGKIGKESLGAWKKTAQPFHWFIEFYTVIKAGGFDVIVGNPPYVEYTKKDPKTKQSIQDLYSLKNYSTEACGDLYAFVMERSASILAKDGMLGMIIPVSIASADGFKPLRKMMLKQSETSWCSSYAERPSKLFTGVEKRLSIWLHKPQDHQGELFVSDYRRWLTEERDLLFQTLGYVKNEQDCYLVDDAVPKIATCLERSILKKVSHQKALSFYYVRSSSYVFYYTRKLRYFVQFFDFVPSIIDGQGETVPPSELKQIMVDKSEHQTQAIAVLNSSLFFWFFNVFSDVRNVNKREVDAFPCSLDTMSSDLIEALGGLSAKLMYDFDHNSRHLTNDYGKHGKLIIQSFQPRYSKPIIDQIDRVLAKHYGFTDEETDFIINYDIKYRMGRGGEEADTEE